MGRRCAVTGLQEVVLSMALLVIKTLIMHRCRLMRRALIAVGHCFALLSGVKSERNNDAGQTWGCTVELRRSVGGEQEAEDGKSGHGAKFKECVGSKQKNKKKKQNC